MRTLLIIGAGGHGRVVAETAQLVGFEKLILLDDSYPNRIQSGPFEIAGKLDTAAIWQDRVDGAIVAIGDNLRRLQLSDWLLDLGFHLQAIIHPSAYVSTAASIGPGSFVGAGAVVNIGSVIGESVVVNTRASIDHDCRIERGAHIAPGVTLSGDVRVDQAAWLGTGSSVKQGIEIGENAVVGVGAAVIRDVSAGQVHVGVPARQLHR